MSRRRDPSKAELAPRVGDRGRARRRVSRAARAATAHVVDEFGHHLVEFLIRYEDDSAALLHRPTRKGTLGMVTHDASGDWVKMLLLCKACRDSGNAFGFAVDVSEVRDRLVGEWSAGRADGSVIPRSFSGDCCTCW